MARIASAALWVLAIVTVIGLMYGVMFAVFFFIMHLLFVGHLRGNGGRRIDRRALVTQRTALNTGWMTRAE